MTSIEIDTSKANKMIQEYLWENDISVSWLAKRMGTEASYIYKITNNRKSVSMKTLYKLSLILGINPVDYIDIIETEVEA